MRLPRKRGSNLAHVVRRDVPAIGARMHGDAGSARGDTDADSLEHAGQLAAARVPERRDLVDVDGEVDQFPISRLTTSTISWAQARISPS